MRLRTGLVLGLLLAMGVAGCSTTNDGNKVATASGQRTATSSAKPGEQDPVKFAQCMRDNGVPDFPDPTVSNDGHVSMGLPPDAAAADKQKVDAATQKCNHYLPNGGEPQKLDPQQVEQMRKLAQCMRDNGVPDFPDPDANGNIPLINGGSPAVENSPKFQKLQAAQKACAKYAPGGTPNTNGGK